MSVKHEVDDDHGSHQFRSKLAHNDRPFSPSIKRSNGKACFRTVAGRQKEAVWYSQSIASIMRGDGHTYSPPARTAGATEGSTIDNREVRNTRPN